MLGRTTSEEPPPCHRGVPCALAGNSTPQPAGFCRRPNLAPNSLAENSSRARMSCGLHWRRLSSKSSSGLPYKMAYGVLTDWLRGMDHLPSCVLCYQQPETTTHLLLTCPFAREIWYNALIPLCLHRFTPNGDATLSSLWPSLSAAAPAFVYASHMARQEQSGFQQESMPSNPSVGQNPY